MTEKFAWLDEYLMSLTAAEKDYKAEWDWHRYMVGGKMFAALMHPADKHDPAYAGKDLINLKCDPTLSELLRSEHPEIMPGFYSDKKSWNSVDLGGGLSQEMIKELAGASYKLIFEKLTKKLQRELLGE